MACACELAGSSPAEGFEGFAEFWVLQDDEPPALGSDGAGGEASGFEDVGDVVVADILLGVKELDCAAALGCVKDELLDVLVLHRRTFRYEVVSASKSTNREVSLFRDGLIAMKNT